MLEKVGNPIRIAVDTTRRCNLTCWYCHSSSGPSYNGPELTDRDIINIYDAGEKLKVFDITLTGGEPTLWKGLESAMDASKDLSYPALQIITNATALDKQKLQSLKRGKISRILVSLDGTKEIHEQNRGQNSYDKTIEGIQSLQEIVDNITVISVLDNTNYDKWPELTQSLIDIGIKQHHLTPVCFAGGAIDNYKGLTESQFAFVREAVNHITPNLPSSFKLVFNDILINKSLTRSIPLNLFCEKYKGWHLVVRPNGDVNIAVRGWGRSWRENETLGNLKDEMLTDMVLRTSDIKINIIDKKFDSDEEVRRKFHLGNPSRIEIERDINDINSTKPNNTLLTHKIPKDTNNSLGRYDEIFYVPLQDSPKRIAEMLILEPNRYVLKNEKGFGFLFDKQSFNITILRQDELDEINKNFFYKQT